MNRLSDMLFDFYERPDQDSNLGVSKDHDLQSCALTAPPSGHEKINKS